MRQGEHEAYSVCAGEDHGFLRDADEAREVVVLILHRSFQTFQPVDAGVCLEKLRALADCLLVGEYLLDIFEFGAGQDEQGVVNFEFDASYNMETVIFHQVVDLVYRAVGAVFNRFNGGEHALEILEI